MNDGVQATIWCITIPNGATRLAAVVGQNLKKKKCFQQRGELTLDRLPMAIVKVASGLVDFVTH